MKEEDTEEGINQVAIEFEETEETQEADEDLQVEEQEVEVPEEEPRQEEEEPEAPELEQSVFAEQEIKNELFQRHKATE